MPDGTAAGARCHGHRTLQHERYSASRGSRACGLASRGRRLRQAASELVAGLRGRVLEVGAGDGRKLRPLRRGGPLRCSPVEPEAYLRELARTAAAAAAAPVTVIDGDAEVLAARGRQLRCGRQLACAVLGDRPADPRSPSCTAYWRPAASCASSSTSSPSKSFCQGRSGQSSTIRACGRTSAGAATWRATPWGAIAAAGFAVERIRRFTSGPGAASGCRSCSAWRGASSRVVGPSVVRPPLAGDAILYQWQ